MKIVMVKPYEIVKDVNGIPRLVPELVYFAIKIEMYGYLIIQKARIETYFVTLAKVYEV